MKENETFDVADFSRAGERDVNNTTLFQSRLGDAFALKANGFSVEAGAMFSSVVGCSCDDRAKTSLGAFSD